jgi:hypothetical protein
MAKELSASTALMQNDFDLVLHDFDTLYIPSLWRGLAAQLSAPVHASIMLNLKSVQNHSVKK